MATLENKLFAVVAILCMLAVAWLIGTYLWNLTEFGTTDAVDWILRITLIFTLMIGIAIVPLMIAGGREVHPLNGIQGLGWLFMAFVLTYLLTGFVWDFNQMVFTNLQYNPTLLFIGQFTIIMLVFIFNFIAPALIMLGDVTIGGNEPTRA